MRPSIQWIHLGSITQMRSVWKWSVWLSLIVSSASPALAVELEGFDKDVMQAMDDAFKDLEPVIGARNTEAAISDVQVLLEGYQWTGDYFKARTDTPDAVQWNAEGHALLESVLASLNRQDFEKAAESARATAKNCKACHEVYKKSLSR